MHLLMKAFAMVLQQTGTENVSSTSIIALARMMNIHQVGLLHTRIAIVEAIYPFQSLLYVAEIVFQYVSYDILLRIY